MDHMWTFPVDRVISNYDGDSYKVILDLGFHLYQRADIRLRGVDTPELRRGTGSTELTRAAAKLARDLAAQWIESADEVVFHSTGYKGKYGRPLGDLYLDGDSLSESLIKANLAVEYDGGSKSELHAQHQSNAELLKENGLLDKYLRGTACPS